MLVTVLVAAFITTMRTERGASENYAERAKAQAIAVGMVNRILADHAARPDQPLKPYEVNSETKEPTTETVDAYLNEDPDQLRGIYSMVPSPSISADPKRLPANHLIRVSEPSGQSETAYSPSYWAYAGQTETPAYYPANSAGAPIAPAWVDYVDANGDKIGEVAYTIWDEGGKFDINIAGADSDIEAVNGMAPYDLQLEKALASDSSSDLLEYLDSDGNRERSNFSLRRISTNPNTDNTGNDRWFFSIEELIERQFLSPPRVFDATTFSRDFDVRPEWDGDRSATEAQSFLKSFLNNPNIFTLFETPGAGPQLVTDTLDEKEHKERLGQAGLPKDDPEWLQIMRLLAVLRKSLPPWEEKDASSPDAILPNNVWFDADIWGIALNVVQAGMRVEDWNLTAWDRSDPNNRRHKDPGARLGVRVSPFITEAAVKVKRGTGNKITITVYWEIWNPYAVDLSNTDYVVREKRGRRWPEVEPTDALPGGVAVQSLNPNPNSEPIAPSQITMGPGPDEFKVVSYTREASLKVGDDFKMASQPGLIWGSVDGIQDSLTVEQRHVSSAILVTAPAGGPPEKEYSPVFVIPARDPADPSKKILDEPGSTHWFSFQIDDPRMAGIRYAPDPLSTDPAKYQTPMPYSWKAYPNRHSLHGIGVDGSTTAEKFTHPLQDGFNENFLDDQNVPSEWKGLSAAEKLKRAYATFALPRRPLVDAAEIATVFAGRPWRTLRLGATVAPNDSQTEIGSSSENYTASFLDYFTALGTTTMDKELAYDAPDRKQAKRWLFESVDSAGNPVGDLRPLRGRINLNSASEDLLTHLLAAPYRQIKSLATPVNLEEAKPTPPNDQATNPSEVEESITSDEANKIAKDLIAIRPIRRMADLGKLDGPNYSGLAAVRQKYYGPLADAALGRLAKFGTVRQQAFTIDVVARAVNPNDTDVVTAEVRLLAHVYFDTFQRKAFIESVEYR